MKIIVSLDEAREAVRRHFSLPASAVIVLGRKGQSSSQSILAESAKFKTIPPEVPDKIRRLIDVVDSLISSRNLIGAIKEIRAFNGSGLKSAKDTAENWASVRAQAIMKGYLPEPIYGSSVSGEILKWT